VKKVMRGWNFFNILRYLHCCPVQRLAQLASCHAQLCYSLSHTKLVSGTVEAIEDPTYPLAIHGCFAEINTHNISSELVPLNPQWTNHPLHPDMQHPLVASIAAKWYLLKDTVLLSPGFRPGFYRSMSDLAIFYLGYGLPHRALILGLSRCYTAQSNIRFTRTH
jgi:hypothetical protein